ncbi:MAG: O-antigen ligase family protein [Rhodovibrionaceae bacterium]
MQRIVLYLFLALVVLAPLPLASNRPLPALALAAGLGAVLLLWSLAALRERALVSIPPRYSFWLAAPFLLYLLWAWLLTLPGFGPPHPVWLQAEAALQTPLRSRAALSPSAAGATLINVMGYGAAFWLALHLGRRSRDARLILGVLAVAMVAYALYGLAMLLGGFDRVLWYERWAYRDSVTSTFVNRNNYATYAGLGLLLVLALFVEQIHAAARLAVGGLRAAIVGVIDESGTALWLLMTAVLVIAAALVLTGSRAGVGAAGIGVLALFAAFGLARGTRARIWLLGLVAILAAGAAIASIGGAYLLDRLVDLEANATSRLELLKLALQQIAERPWFGHGPGSFPAVFELARSEAFDEDLFSYQRVHNTYLEVALESGLPGLALLLGAIVWANLLCLRGVLRRREAYVFPAIGLAATALVAVHSLVDFGLQIPAVSVTYFTLLGLGVAQSWRRSDIEGRPGPRRDPAEDESA